MSLSETRNCHNPGVDYKERVTEIASLMEEFRLSEARLELEGFTIAFKRKLTNRSATPLESESTEMLEEPIAVATPVVPVGIPITSPMNGIFYASPSPSSPPFVKEGDNVVAGQIIGLVEAMKLFNEVPCTTSGVVKKVVAESGQVVNPGDTLLIVG